MKIRCRVVLDTSVLVAAFFQSRSLSILKEWRKGSFVLCYSPSILKEYKHILQKIPPIRSKAESFLLELQENPSTLLVVDPPGISVLIDDPDDKKFLACAVAAGADTIVSLDRHLLQLFTFQEILIVRPGQFLQRFSPKASSPETLRAQRQRRNQ